MKGFQYNMKGFQYKMKGFQCKMKGFQMNIKGFSLKLKEFQNPASEKVFLTPSQNKSIFNLDLGLFEQRGIGKHG